MRLSDEQLEVRDCVLETAEGSVIENSEPEETSSWYSSDSSDSDEDVEEEEKEEEEEEEAEAGVAEAYNRSSHQSACSFHQRNRQDGRSQKEEEGTADGEERIREVIDEIDHIQQLGRKGRSPSRRNY